MLAKIKAPPIVARVVYLGAFKYNFSFTLTERKSPTLDQLQVDALEVEANFASTGKSSGKQETTGNRRGKEEASSSGQTRESPHLKLEELDQLIRSLSHNVGKLKIQNKSPSKQNA